MILLILKNKGSYIEVTRRLEDRTTNKIWNTITKPKRSSSTGCKDQTEKVLDEDKFLTKNSYLILWEGIVIVSILLFLWTFQQLYLLVEVTLEEEEALLPLDYSHQKIWEIWKKWLSKPADALKWLAGEAVEALRAIVVSDVGAILSCLVKPVGSAAEHTRAIIVFFAELIGGMVDAKSEKSKIGQ